MTDCLKTCLGFRSFVFRAARFTQLMEVSRSIFFRFLIAIVSIAGWTQEPVDAWDADGHQLVATIAYSRLNPKAQRAVTALAREGQAAGRPYDAVTMAG